MTKDSSTMQDNDPTGVWAMARQTYETAVRRGAVVLRRQPHLEDADEGTFADWLQTTDDSTTQLALWAEETSTVVTQESPIGRSWISPEPVRLTPLDAPVSTPDVRTFAPQGNWIDPIRWSWPNGTNPIFDEVDADVTHPLTPTGKPAKRGPKLPFTDGLPFDDYMQVVRQDQDRATEQFVIGMAGLPIEPDEHD